MAIPTTTYDIATISNPTSVLTDFTLMVDLSRMSTAWWAAVNSSDGTRGRASKSDGTTELATDWIDFNDTAETGWLRVKWTGTLASTGTQIIRIYPPNTANTSYGVSDTYGQYNAYDSDWYLYSPDGGNVDRTGNFTLTSFGSPSIGGVAGKIGNATAYSSSQYTDTNQIFAIGLVGTVSAWIKDVTGYAIGVKFNSMSIQLSGTNYDTRWAADSIVKSNTITPTNYTHVVFDSDGVDRHVYTDKSLSADVETVGTAVDSDWLTIGDRSSGASSSVATINELHAHKINRAESWIFEESDQTADNATFWGTWTNVPAGSGTAYTLLAETGSVVLNSQDVGLKTGKNILSTVGNIFVSGKNTILKLSRRLFSTTDNITVDGKNILLSRSFSIESETGSIINIGHSVTLQRATIIIADTGNIIATGYDANLGNQKSYVLSAEPGSVLVDGKDINLLRESGIVSDAENIILTGYDVKLIWSGESILNIDTIVTTGTITRKLQTAGTITRKLQTTGILERELQTTGDLD